MPHSRFFRCLLFSIVLAIVAPLVGETRASACAVLPSNGAKSAPDLAQERVLILFDRQSKTEHFVREVRFEKATSRFAFLVPSPTKPEVEKVEQAPFDALEGTYPFQPPEPVPRGAKSAALRAPVEVHEVKRIGSFTAFVLSATDAAALDQWFSENDIARPENAVQWLSHFVDKRFFLTAFRYEPPESANGEIVSETVRLTFRTDDAYYPYIEPLRSGSAPERSLAVWTMAEESLVPAALFAPEKGPLFWKVAWLEGAAYNSSRTDLEAQLPGIADLLPQSGSIRIQTFLDTRASRNGVSDIVLANDGVALEDAGFRARAAKLIGDLDKLLHSGENYPPDGGAPTDILRANPTSRGCACRFSGTGQEGTLPATITISMLLGLLVARRRRR